MDVGQSLKDAEACYGAGIKRKNEQHRTSGVIWSCVQDKVTHERGIPYECDAIATEGVGYAHSSVDTRKGKNGKSEGALLLKRLKVDGQAAANDESSSLS